MSKTPVVQRVGNVRGSAERQLRHSASVAARVPARRPQREDCCHSLWQTGHMRICMHATFEGDVAPLAQCGAHCQCHCNLHCKSLTQARSADRRGDTAANTGRVKRRASPSWTNVREISSACLPLSSVCRVSFPFASRAVRRKKCKARLRRAALRQCPCKEAAGRREEGTREAHTHRPGTRTPGFPPGGTPNKPHPKQSQPKHSKGRENRQETAPLRDGPSNGRGVGEGNGERRHTTQIVHETTPRRGHRCRASGGLWFEWIRACGTRGRS
jgi:hypothetical protein